jgi:hypothetical protein
MGILWRSSLLIGLLVIFIALGLSLNLRLSDQVFRAIETKANHDWSSIYGRSLELCEQPLPTFVCKFLISPIKLLPETVRPLESLYTFAYEVRRKKFSTNKLPILKIYISNGALDKFKKKRSKLLSKNLPIRFTERGDWVKGKLVFTDGDTTSQFTAKLRLKGSFQDHFEDPRKWSLRIKTKPNHFLRGMRTFSIHQPSARGDYYENMIHHMMDMAGVLSPNYLFVDVRLNDRVVGVMALEEFPAKEMAELNSRREGAFVGLDDKNALHQEDLLANYHPDLWQQVKMEARNPSHHLLFDGEPNLPEWRHIPLALVDYAAQSWPESKLSDRSRSSYNALEGISILRDMIAGKISVSDALDYRSLIRWWLITQVWSANHPFDQQDRRYFFNPISRTLESISWDNQVYFSSAEQRSEVWENHGLKKIDHSIAVALTDPEFAKLLKREAEALINLFSSSEFEHWFTSSQRDYQQILLLDEQSPVTRSRKIREMKIKYADFENRLQIVMAEALELATKSLNKSKPSENSDRAYRSRQSESLTKRQRILIGRMPLATHLRTFLFKSGSKYEIEIKNLTLDPIQIRKVSVSQDPNQNLIANAMVLPPDNQRNNNHVLTLPINLDRNVLDKKLVVNYQYRDEQYSQFFTTQFRNFLGHYLPSIQSVEILKQLGAIVDNHDRLITLPSGDYEITAKLQTPFGWNFVIDAGATIKLMKGAKLRVNGSLTAAGTVSNPITFEIGNDSEFHPYGSWGGLIIDGLESKSLIENVIFRGTPSNPLLTRQDSLGITGCVTFFRGTVDLKHSEFSGLNCEDSLNLISTEFSIENVKIDKSSGDGLDIDFSNGVIKTLTVTDSGNDGIDFSGSIVSARLVEVRHSQDKGISVGEASSIDIDQSSIQESTTGIVSKDRSIVNVSNTQFSDVSGTALMVYIKKSQYGPAQMNCSACTFERVSSVSASQENSLLIINGQNASNITSPTDPMRSISVGAD